MATDLTDEVCNIEFLTYRPEVARFCSNACYAKHRRMSGFDDIIKSCIVCGKEFSSNKFDGVMACSRHCGGIINAYNRARKSKIS